MSASAKRRDASPGEVAVGVALLSALSVAAHACASAPAAPNATANAPVESAPVSAYVALAVGNAWTYEVRTGGSAASTSDTVRITGRDGPWFLDDHRGRLRLDGLGLRDGDRYLLRGPLAPGASWSSVEQMAVQRFKITAIDAAVQTRAGLFEKCVVVQNSEPLAQGTSFVTEWTYAPGVGLVALHTKTVTSAGKEQEQLRLALVKFEQAAK